MRREFPICWPSSDIFQLNRQEKANRRRIENVSEDKRNPLSANEEGGQESLLGEAHTVRDNLNCSDTMSMIVTFAKLPR